MDNIEKIQKKKSVIWTYVVLQCGVRTPWFTPFLLNLMQNVSVKLGYKTWCNKFREVLIHVIWTGLTCLLLREGDIGVHQAPSNAEGNKRDKICSRAENTRCKTAQFKWCLSYLMFRPVKLVQENM